MPSKSCERRFGGLTVGDGHGAPHAPQRLGALDALLGAGLQVVGVALDILQDTRLLIFLLETPQGLLQRFVPSDSYFNHVGVFTSFRALLRNINNQQRSLRFNFLKYNYVSKISKPNRRL